MNHWLFSTITRSHWKIHHFESVKICFSFFVAYHHCRDICCYTLSELITCFWIDIYAMLFKQRSIFEYPGWTKSRNICKCCNIERTNTVLITAIYKQTRGKWREYSILEIRVHREHCHYDRLFHLCFKVKINLPRYKL